MQPYLNALFYGWSALLLAFALAMVRKGIHGRWPRRAPGQYRCPSTGERGPAVPSLWAEHGPTTIQGQIVEMVLIDEGGPNAFPDELPAALLPMPGLLAAAPPALVTLHIHDESGLHMTAYRHVVEALDNAFKEREDEDSFFTSDEWEALNEERDEARSLSNEDEPPEQLV